MLRKVVKKAMQFAGLDIRRYNNSIDWYKSLYYKHREDTMIPEEFFVLNLELCDRFKHISGDYVECGVWRGGMSAAIAEVLGKDRQVHLFDSFEGLPKAKEIDGQDAIAWQNNTQSSLYFDNCTADETFAQRAMARANHSSYQLYKGWFDQTLKNYQGKSIGILRLDGDWYDSVLTCLQSFYPKVASGGIIIIDDYYAWDGCSKAVHDYLSQTKSTSRLFQYGDQISYLIKKN